MKKLLSGKTAILTGASSGAGYATTVILARAAGLQVIGTVGSEQGKALVQAQGAHHVLNHHNEGYLDSLQECTCGYGVDVILEMLANVNLDRDLGVMAKGGRVVIIGSRGRVEIDPRSAMGQESTILGMTLYNASDKELASMHAAFVEGLGNGTVRPVVSRELPLAEAATAHHAVMEMSTLGKIVLLRDSSALRQQL